MNSWSALLRFTLFGSFTTAFLCFVTILLWSEGRDGLVFLFVPQLLLAVAVYALVAGAVVLPFTVFFLRRVDLSRAKIYVTTTAWVGTLVLTPVFEALTVFALVPLTIAAMGCCRWLMANRSEQAADPA